MAESTSWRVLVTAEVVLASVTVILDLWVPTLLLLMLAALSLLVHRQGPAAFGLVKPAAGRRWPVQVLGLAVAWTLITIALTTPVLEHVTGQRQDVDQFADVEGNVALLAVLLVLSWTLAAFGEEFAYRGFLLTRVRELVGGDRLGTASTVAASVIAALLFGWAHRDRA